MALLEVTSTEFQQNVGRYQDEAQRAPVTITKNGRAHTVMLSAAMFEILRKGRVARKVDELDEATHEAILNARVSAEHAHLDRLLDNWTP